MEKVKTYPYDTTDYLNSARDIAFFLVEIFETEDSALISKALGIVARSKGMAEVALKTGLSRESLSKTLNAAATAELATILKVMKTLDLKLTTTAAA